MKHLVFKSVLGVGRNELPLIKARHVISAHVAQRRPRPGAGPDRRTGQEWVCAAPRTRLLQTARPARSSHQKRFNRGIKNKQS